MLPPEGKFRQFCFSIADHDNFEVVVMAVILLNTMLLAVKYPGMSERTNDITEKINYFFTFFFCIEAIIKLFAFGKRYFRELWNIFDFSIVISSIVFIVLEEVLAMNLSGTTQVIRSIRIGRIFRLFKKMKQLHIIFLTFINTFSSLINVGGLMFLIIYIYAVIGIKFFADVKVQSPMHERLNF